MKIIENLIAPDTKERLILDIDSGTIQNLNTDLFYGKIVDGIPIILPKTTKNQLIYINSLILSLIMLIIIQKMLKSLIIFR